MINHFKILTVTHQNLNVEDISRFTVDRSDWDTNEKVYQGLSQLLEAQELVYISTCNRVTYLFHSETNWSSTDLGSFFSAINPRFDLQNAQEAAKYVQYFEGSEAIEHLFRVSASMESLVIGEREIFRQIRQSFQTSQNLGFINDNFRLLDKHMVSCAKQVYAQTGIGENPVSVVSLAIQKFKELDLDLDSKILIVGAGETNTLAAKFLKKYGYTNAVIFNRSLDNAVDLQNLLDAPAYHLSELAQYDKGFDAIFICTASTKPLIDSKLYQHLIGRDQSEKVIVDLSVPHNVDDDVLESYNINYIDIETLRNLAETNMNLRRTELTKAQSYVQDKLQAFNKAIIDRQIEKMLQFLPSQIQDIKKQAVDEVYRHRLDQLDPQSKALVIEMMDYMAKKCVAAPMKLARESKH